MMYAKQMLGFFDNSPVPIFIFDEYLEIQEVNQAFSKFAEKKRESLLSCPVFSAINKSFFLEFKDIFDKLRNENKKFIKVERWIKNDEWRQKCFSITINLGPIYNGKRFYISFVEDITGLKSFEQKLEEVKDIAEQVAKTKSEFIANVSHEIRTPLHTIIGMSELMLDTPLNIEQKEYADQILFSAGVLLSLVNDILDFSKIEAGKLELEKIEFNLYETLEDTTTLVAMEAHKKGLEVVLSIAPKVPTIIKSDPVRLRQIIINLLNNAIKFTKEGEVVLSVLVDDSSPEKTTLKFIIKDTGVGIPENKKHILFSAFSQADSSVTRKFGGTGLGLSISKQLSELFEGKIGVESVEGKGSVFWFTINVEILPESNVSRQEKLKLTKKTGILIVDDNKTSRKLIKSYLEEVDAKIFEAESGLQALEFLNANEVTTVDLLLIDQRMPGMDGWQLASEINTDGRFSDIKKILMTPIGLGGDEAKMKLLNWFDNYINKPIKKSALYSAIFKALDIVVDIEEPKSVNTEQELEIIKELLVSRRKKFLLAEDYYINQKLFKTILESLNIEVKIADNGLEAVELAGEEKFDIILMDIQMPVMNGIDASKKIREMGIKTPIIAVTANTVVGEMEGFAEAGMDDFLFKPFKKSDLVQLFSKWLISEDDIANLEELGSVEEQKQKHIQDSHGKTDKKEIPDSSQLSENKKTFDYEKALEIFIEEKEILLETIEEFEKRVGKQLADMKLLLRDRDFESLRREAHSIKGGSWNLAMADFGTAAEKLENSAKNKEMAVSFDNLKNLILLYPKLRREILSTLQRERSKNE